MAVTTTTIAGTDSLSGSRITINDNFKTLEDALNSVLSAFDIVSGRFDNSLYGSANDILTNGIVINGTGLVDGVTVNNGNVNLLNGDVKVSLTNSYYIGSQLKLNDYPLALIPAVGGNFPTWDFQNPGGTSNFVGGMVLPHLTAAGFTAVEVAGPTPKNGTLVFNDFGGGPATLRSPLKLWWDGAGSHPGGTWWAIGATTL